MNVEEMYEILELDLNVEATLDNLKKQFKKMALKYHPDRNPDKDTTDKFIKLQEAFEYLKQYLEIKNNPPTIIPYNYYNSNYNTSTTGDQFTFTWRFN